MKRIQKHNTMKTTRLYTPFALLMVFAVSCNKPDEPDNHEYVDLDLPSGTLWATCNVGSNTPEGYGNYFAWGEITSKTTYNWSTYKYCNGDYNQLTKYCNYSSYGYNGFTDNLTTLKASDDAATANWGRKWCMPTQHQWEELYSYTTYVWTTQNGVNGRLFTSTNGNSIFLPAAGDFKDDAIERIGEFGLYGSSSLANNEACTAFGFNFYSGNLGMSGYARCHGRSIRPVRSTK